MSDLRPVAGASPPMPPNEPLLVDVPAASKLLGISDRTLWSMTKAGEVPCVRLRRRVLYAPQALRDWVAARAEGGAR
jgi:excisionase family DNA binding protein